MAPTKESSPHHKTLACVVCQQRKKKCDRQTPCSVCTKLNTPCIPSIPAPPRKRRHPTKEILDRLERCEALLRQISYAGDGQDSPSASPPDTRHRSAGAKLPRIQVRKRPRAGGVGAAAVPEGACKLVVLPSVEWDREEDFNALASASSKETIGSPAGD
ncbi:hypothetical protein S7711_03829 [Stachybotrys chartarum IBT 7711]|uniref:Zn(2)-C6 fungal-type domain-containing protein n=1 Tax=Stachybotrys chartarum (strain CBS 109288 / IBT 7711) TaxID=1280523 RepID=A0A084AUB9_STACB|nr:hypothetical protein S7711_03829 [Stachybotrys chartarum IBT 7711]